MGGRVVLLRLPISAQLQSNFQKWVRKRPWRVGKLVSSTRRVTGSMANGGGCRGAQRCCHLMLMRWNFTTDATSGCGLALCGSVLWPKARGGNVIQTRCAGNGEEDGGESRRCGGGGEIEFMIWRNSHILPRTQPMDGVVDSPVARHGFPMCSPRGSAPKLTKSKKYGCNQFPENLNTNGWPSPIAPKDFPIACCFSNVGSVGAGLYVSAVLVQNAVWRSHAATLSDLPT